MVSGSHAACRRRCGSGPLYRHNRSGRRPRRARTVPTDSGSDAGLACLVSRRASNRAMVLWRGHVHPGMRGPQFTRNWRGPSWPPLERGDDRATTSSAHTRGKCFRQTARSPERPPPQHSAKTATCRPSCERRHTSGQRNKISHSSLLLNQLETRSMVIYPSTASHSACRFEEPNRHLQ